MRTAFWQSARVLLNYKRPLAIAMVGAVISAACFGAGLAAMVPTLKILIGTEQDRRAAYQAVHATDLQANQPTLTVESAPSAQNAPAANATVPAADGTLPPHISPEDVLPNYEAPLPRYLHQAANDPEGYQFVKDITGWAAERVPSDPFRGFVLVMGIIAILTVIGSTARYVHELIVLTIAQRGVMVWRLRMYRRLIHAPLEQILQTGTSDHIGRVVADSNVLEIGFRSILGKTVAELTKGLAALIVAFCIDPLLTIIALVAAPPIAILLRKFSKSIRKASKLAMKQRGRIIGLLNESLGSLQVVKVHDAEGYERRRFSRAVRHLFAQEMKKRQARALASPVIETLALFSVIIVATIAAWYMFHSNRPAENLLLVLLMLAAAGNSLKPLTSLQTQLAEADAAATRVLEVTKLPVEPAGPDRPENIIDLPRHKQSVRFDHISYCYPTKTTPALSEVSLDIPFGSTIALVGSNGSGKTTLLSMLPRLLHPTSGRVFIDGQDVQSVSLRSLRKQMAVVTQQNVLFEGTIADNIAYGRRHIPRDRIIAAAKAAYADEFIVALPQGYDTLLGEEGSGLSGGQRQRICIARAMLRNPAILILDEATSQIDADSEAKINQVVREIRQGRTIFIIAHRLSTVIDADMIVVMAQGQIIDQGSHSELLERCELYKTLAQTQLQSA
jgi:ABC-type multidrug transport system fused ATPase/permease subunit